MSVIPGTSNPEDLPGTALDDLITAYGGSDTVYAFGGNDTLYGGAGDDSLFGQFGNDLIFGEAGDDRLESGGDSDQLYGGEGNDLILVNDISYDGESTGYGGAGDDLLSLFGTAHGTVYGGDGIDTMFLGTVSNDALFVDLASQSLDGHGSFPGVTFASIERLNVLSFDGDDTVYGGAYADRLAVGKGRNVVDARGGDDYVSYVAHGAATLDGGAGTDTLAVSCGTSSLYFIYDRLEGDVDDGQGSTILGFERYEAYGGTFADIAGLGLGNDLFRGGRGADTAFGNDGRDRLDGDGGADSLDGGAGRDTLYGGGGADTIFGGAGNDYIGGGNDTGADVVYGGDGDDRIRFGRGNDVASGGLGHDTFLFTLPEPGVTTITDFEHGVDHLKFTGAYLSGGLAAGALDPARLTAETLNGSQAQFITTYFAEGNFTLLEWYPGAPASGATPYVYFEGHITLSASDFLIV